MELFHENRDTITGMARPVPSGPEEHFMLIALELAENGRGRTSPNPIVGAVVVKDGVMIGEGFHEVLGGKHAEIEAIESAGERASGSTMYVTLEPCAHHGRTPACTDAIVEAGIERVVIACRDRNPRVKGGGIERLLENGVDARTGPYGNIARRQNESYFKWVESGIPFVTLKMALSLDGKSSTPSGDSRWITSEESRRDVHVLRSQSDALMVGIGTVLADDPHLTVRLPDAADLVPMRVVVDANARLPLESNLANIREAPTLVAATAEATGERVAELEKRGVKVVSAGDGPLVELGRLMEILGEMDVACLMVEGGATLAYGLWEQGLVDKIVFYYAPKIIGAADAPGPFSGDGAPSMAGAWDVCIDAVFASGPDIKVMAYPRRGE